MQAVRCDQRDVETATLKHVRVCVRFWLRVVTAEFALYILHLSF